VTQPERDEVEQPLGKLLQVLGWGKPLDGAPQDGGLPTDPAASERGSFSDEILVKRFREAVRAINPGPDGSPWLDEARLSYIQEQVLRTRDLVSSTGPVVANQALTKLLHEGVQVDGLPEWEGGRRRTIQLIAWDDWQANDLVAVRQFSLRRPNDGGSAFAVFDLVLCVNGLPLVVVECKNPHLPSAVAHGIEDLRSYTGERESGTRASVPGFFRFVQVLIATDGADAKLGTISSAPEHFVAWKTVAPASLEQASRDLAAAWGPRSSVLKLTEAEQLYTGVLRPAHLLDLIRNFTVFVTPDGRLVKIVARYQQFRAVHAMVRQLTVGRTKVGGADRDERGGVLWHTQGSGKSLTMVFLVRKMRATEGLDKFKIVVVSDRIDLREQLAPVLDLAEKIYVARSSADAKAMLASTTPDLTLMMLQQARRDDADGTAETVSRLLDDPDALPDEQVANFPELNPSPRILFLIDEAHRNQAGWLHARLMKAAPNAAKIGLTGTPIMRARKSDTANIFGPMIDEYSLRQSETDGATVKIRYEGREFDSDIIDRVLLDAAYEEEITGDDKTRDAVARRVKLRDVLESEPLIKAKADDLLRHWVANVLPYGLKGQVVAVSRRAAVRYRAALLQAREELVAQLEAFATGELIVDGERDGARFYADALPFLPLIKVIDFKPVISSAKGDPVEWGPWTDKTKQATAIKAFQRRLPHPDVYTEPSASHRESPDTADTADSGHEPWTDFPAGPGPEPEHTGGDGNEPWSSDSSPDDAFRRPTGASESRAAIRHAEPEPVAFLIVMSMLLTGFDAPIEQALYVDRPIKDAELLQAIARTNRTYRGKTQGLIVDYVALADNLKKALAVYDKPDIVGADVKLLAYELPVVRAQQDRLLRYVRDELRIPVSKLADLAAIGLQNDLLVTLADPTVRRVFTEHSTDFLAGVDALLPRPESLEFEADAKAVGIVQYRAYRLYRDSRSDGVDPYLFGAKVRRLLDQHLRAADMRTAVPPTAITDPDFFAQASAEPDARIRSLHMEHAARKHISERLPADPVRYRRFSERLEAILAQLRGAWDERAAAVTALCEEMLAYEAEADASADNFGIDRRTEQPILSVLEEQLSRTLGHRATDSAESDADWISLVSITRIVVDLVRHGVAPPGFPETAILQETLRKQVRRALMQSNLFSGPAATEAAGVILEIARAARWAYL